MDLRIIQTIALLATFFTGENAGRASEVRDRFKSAAGYSQCGVVEAIHKFVTLETDITCFVRSEAGRQDKTADTFRCAGRKTRCCTNTEDIGSFLIAFLRHEWAANVHPRRPHGDGYGAFELGHLIAESVSRVVESDRSMAIMETWMSNLGIDDARVDTNTTGIAARALTYSHGFEAPILGGAMTAFVASLGRDGAGAAVALGDSRSEGPFGETRLASAGRGMAFAVRPAAKMAAMVLDSASDKHDGLDVAVRKFSPGIDELPYVSGSKGSRCARGVGKASSPDVPTFRYKRQSALPLESTTSTVEVVRVPGGDFETPIPTQGHSERQDAPADWSQSGDGAAGVQNSGMQAPASGRQFAYLRDNVTITTVLDDYTVQPGSYELTVALGNLSGDGKQQEPGTYLVRIGYGPDTSDFNELATELRYGDAIDEEEWEDLTVCCTVAETSQAIGKPLLVQIEHSAADSPTWKWSRGVVDNVRIVRRSATPVLELPHWPTGPGEAILSDKYRVWITQHGVRREAEVLMSVSKDAPGGFHANTDDRTMSYVSLATNFASELLVEVEKIYGLGAAEVEIVPSAYGIDHHTSDDGRTVSFTLDRSRYVSVNFKSRDNQRTVNGMVDNMLIIFADPLEEERPDPAAPNVVSVGLDTTLAQLRKAKTIYFKPGFYRLEGLFGDSILPVYSGQTVYAASGAFILGTVGSVSGATDNMAVIGRGILSGREDVWKTDPTDLVRLEGVDNRVEGIIAIDGNHHGIVSGERSHIERVKMWGWHFNNDGFRPWGGTVHHVFARPVDDAFYVGGRPLTVSDAVIWMGFNGGVVTYGWGDYGQEGFYMRDVHVIHPEWRSLHNNNGFLMSQASAQAGLYDVRFERITIDGDIPGLTNIKIGSDQGNDEPPDLIGELRGLTFKDVTINGRFMQENEARTIKIASKSLLEGAVLNGGADTYLVRDVTFENVIVDGVAITEENHGDYFDIDAQTTSNIQFLQTAPPASQPFTVLESDKSIDFAENALSQEIFEADSDGATSARDPRHDIAILDVASWAASLLSEVGWTPVFATAVRTPVESVARDDEAMARKKVLSWMATSIAGLPGRLQSSANLLPTVTASQDRSHLPLAFLAVSAGATRYLEAETRTETSGVNYVDEVTVESASEAWSVRPISRVIAEPR